MCVSNVWTCEVKERRQCFDNKQEVDLTWELPVHSVDSPVQQTAASLLNPAGCCYSGPALSDWRTGIWGLRTELHSFSLRGYSRSVWRRRKRTFILKCWVSSQHVFKSLLFHHKHVVDVTINHQWITNEQTSRNQRHMKNKCGRKWGSLIFRVFVKWSSEIISQPSVKHHLLCAGEKTVCTNLNVWVWVWLKKCHKWKFSCGNIFPCLKRFCANR